MPLLRRLPKSTANRQCSETERKRFAVQTLFHLFVPLRALRGQFNFNHDVGLIHQPLRKRKPSTVAGVVIGVAGVEAADSRLGHGGL